MIVRAIALLLCSASALPAAAQDRAADPSATQDIVVIGRGLPTRPGDRTADVVAIDAARIRESASGRLETVLADVEGCSSSAGAIRARPIRPARGCRCAGSAAMRPAARC